MVVSRLDNTITYNDTKKINKEDINEEKNIYEITLNIDPRSTDTYPINIVLGNQKINKNIAYYPIYLIYDNKVDSQIGIFETYIDDLPNMLDTIGDPDLEKFTAPILYDFINSVYLNEKKTEPILDSIQQQQKEEEQQQEIIDDNIVYEDDNNDELLDIEEIEGTYIPKDTDYWVNKAFNSNKYKEIDNEGDGDCLFAVIRDALQNDKITISYLRNLLADSATQEVFDNYRKLYEDGVIEFNKIKADRKEIINKNNALVIKMKEERDRDKKVEIAKLAEQYKLEHKKLGQMLQDQKEYLEEYIFMNNVNNIDELRDVIKTKKFWADTWAISTLEAKLNIKLILLSREAFDSGDIANILLCGALDNRELELKGVFKPKYYILTDYRGRHYELAQYDGKNKLLFNEIPQTIKKLIIEKCLEKNAGVYSIIPKMQKYKEKLNIVEEDNNNGPPIDITSDLYDANTVFQYYSRSGDTKPGKGSGEKIKDENRKDFNELSKIKDWRKKLSNFWIQPFELDGHKWNSVEHYYQANKFRHNSPDFYIKFMLDSNSDISKDSKIAKSLGGKGGKYSKEIFRPKDIKIDEDFFTSGRNEKVMYDAIKAKFMQNEDLRNMLLLTKYARLMHYIRGRPPIEITDLMRVRKELIT